MTGLFQRVNWVDVLALILLIRISYISSRIGVGKQILPLILLVFILLLSLYNYRIIAEFFIERYAFWPVATLFFSYLLMTIVFFIIYYLASRLTGFYFSPGETTTIAIEKIGGAILGLIRSTLIIGIILIGLLLTPVKFVESSIKNSYLGFFYVSTNLKIYAAIANLVFKDGGISPEKELSDLFSKEEDLLNLKQ